MYQAVKCCNGSIEAGQATDALAAEMKRLKIELKRVTEERDILKRPPCQNPDVFPVGANDLDRLGPD